MSEDRDYLKEMNAAIADVLPDGDYAAAIVAQELYEKLLANDEDLLNGWLWANARHFLTETIGDRRRRTRSYVRHHGPRKAFGERAQAAEDAAAAGDPQALKHFAQEYEIDDAHTIRRVADMTGADHIFVADAYARDKKTAAMLEAFHRAVAKKVGKRRTADVFSEEQYGEMLRSITGE